MLNFFSWYITLTALGLLTFPLAYRLFPALADRGYALSRALGLLLWSFAFWLAVSLGLAHNDAGGILLGLVALAALNLLANWVREKADANRELDFLSPVEWLRSNWRYVVSVEVLFLLAFAAMAFVRASNPEATGTEKPMEMAFINAIMRSDTFPPHDPWLSGYAISYYYFGYVMTAMLARFTLTSGPVAFNLMSALVFSLAAVGIFGIVYNLLRAYWKDKKKPAMAGAFFAPIFLLVLSNIEGFLELLHAYGIGWSGDRNFWTWLAIKDLNEPPSQPYGWSPRFWFWWRASRVITDIDFRGSIPEVIDEFPFFSFLLGDLHPHVLAIPFTLLAVGMALNLFLGGWEGEMKVWRFSLPIRREAFLLLAVTLGGLAFLNTWDFPIYLAVVAGAFVLYRIRTQGWDWQRLEEFFWLSIPLALLAVLLYLPFYAGFSSQAGGILPNVVFPTRGAHLWVMFATLFVPIFGLFIYLARVRAMNWKLGLSIAIGLALFLWLFSLLLGWIVAQTDIGAGFIESQGFAGLGPLLAQAALRRLQYIAGLGTLILLLGAGLAYLTVKPAEGRGDSGSDPIWFVALLVVIGALLVLAPEFVYLRDQFGTRMNTIFKFYYQAWVVWSIGAAFAFTVLLVELRGNIGRVMQGLLWLVLGMGLVYPFLALPNKTNGFSPFGGHTLDASAYLSQYFPDDAAAIAWLYSAPPGVVVEAVGGSYSDYARVSTYSGQPSVLGWPGHESQWRGGYVEQGSRAGDIERLYVTPDVNEARQIISQYGIKYVYIGGLERTTYKVNEEKFARFMKEVYRQGPVVIYEAP